MVRPVTHPKEGSADPRVLTMAKPNLRENNGQSSYLVLDNCQSNPQVLTMTDLVL
jgi:hypothetical protein